MPETNSPNEQQPVTPSRRDRLRPLELIGFAGVLTVFAGLIVLMATRSWLVASISAVSVFIVTVMTVALIGLGGKPSPEDMEARKDLKGDSGPQNWH